MADEPTTAQMHSTDSEPCGSCGYPLAIDQRYCLNCGRRRGEARVDYAPFIGAAGGVSQADPAPAPVAPAPLASPPRETSPLVAVAGIALLGLMLLVGVLIGRGDGSGTEMAAAPPPTVVTVGEGDAQVADAAAGAADDAAAKKDASAGGNGGSDSKTAGSSDAEEGSTENPVTASRDELEQLENSSGDDYEEASQNLPDTIAIPGEAPPKDDEAPGGGTSATVIK